MSGKLKTKSNSATSILTTPRRPPAGVAHPDHFAALIFLLRWWPNEKPHTMACGICGADRRRAVYLVGCAQALGFTQAAWREAGRENMPPISREAQTLIRAAVERLEAGSARSFADLAASGLLAENKSLTPARNRALL